MKWKSNLLSSGVPLEYEATKIAESLECEVSFEYTYNRVNEFGIPTDFSVDLLLHKNIIKNNLNARLILPVECKYRTPDTKWLFLPELTPEEEQTTEFFSSVAAFSTNQKLAYGDTFILLRFLDKAIKGIEIKGDSVYDKEIKRGIQQLKYALPKVAIDALFNYRWAAHIEDCLFIIVPILLTTAKLYIANDNCSIDTVGESKEITEIAREICNLAFIPSDSTEYQIHCQRTVRMYKDLSISINDQSESKVKANNCSKELLYSMQDPIISVCTLEYFEGFLNELATCVYNDLEFNNMHQRNF